MLNFPQRWFSFAHECVIANSVSKEEFLKMLFIVSDVSVADSNNVSANAGAAIDAEEWTYSSVLNLPGTSLRLLIQLPTGLNIILQSLN